MAKKIDYLQRAQSRLRIIDWYQKIANPSWGVAGDFTREEIEMIHKDLDRLIKRHRRLRDADMWLDSNEG